MSKFVFALLLTVSSFAFADSDKAKACRGEKSCFMALSGLQMELCQAYKEGRSCFMAINDSTQQAWCQVILEGKSCFMALDGEEREKCENDEFPGDHIYWKNCRDNGNGGGCFIGNN